MELVFIYTTLDSHVNVLFAFESWYIGLLEGTLLNIFYLMGTINMFALKISVRSHTFPLTFSNVSTVKLDIHHINFQILFSKVLYVVLRIAMMSCHKKDALSFPLLLVHF